MRLHLRALLCYLPTASATFSTLCSFVHPLFSLLSACKFLCPPASSSSFVSLVATLDTVSFHLGSLLWLLSVDPCGYSRSTSSSTLVTDNKRERVASYILSPLSVSLSLCLCLSLSVSHCLAVSISLFLSLFISADIPVPPCVSICVSLSLALVLSPSDVPFSFHSIHPNIPSSVDGALDCIAMDLLWADPASAEDNALMGQHGLPPGFAPNMDRGGDACVFGEEAVRTFTQATSCEYILRAHQPPDKGIRYQAGAKVVRFRVRDIGT